MKLPFLSQKAEQAVNKVVDVAGEKVQQAIHAAADDKLRTVAIALPIIATAFLVFSNSKSSNDIRVPDMVIINNYYYGGGAE